MVDLLFVNLDRWIASRRLKFTQAYSLGWNDFGSLPRALN
jgi:hypothetical protein